MDIEASGPVTNSCNIYRNSGIYMIITFFSRPAVATVSEVGSVTSVVAASASAIPTVTTTILLLLYWSWLEKF